MAGRRQTATMATAIGATMVGAVVILMVMLLAWGNSSTFLTKHYWLVVIMNNVGGLREGAPVKIGGFQIGKVSSITLQPGNTELELALSIQDAFLLPEGSSAKISTAGLVGDAFLEIIPGTSNTNIKQATTIAEAARIHSAATPDLSELFTQVASLGEKLNTLVVFVNDILGDDQFRKNIKTIASNLEDVSYEANRVIQRSHRVVDNIERATQNVVGLSDTLKVNVEIVSGKAVEVADKLSIVATRAGDNIVKITDQVSDITDIATKTFTNLDGGITEIRKAVSDTLGDPKVAENLNLAVKNIADLTGTLKAKSPEIETFITGLNTVAVELTAIGGRVNAIVAGIDPARITSTMDTLSSAVASVTEVIDKIKNDPVLALSINKAADRIVARKFEEMSKNAQTKSADQQMREIQRWTNDALKRGHYIDPSYSHDRRPYAMDP